MTGWLEWLRLDDDGITVRNFVQAYRIGWHEVRRFEDGSESGRRGRHWWALRIVLRDGRVIIADGTSSLQTAARPQALAAIRRAAERHEIPAALTGMPPATGPGVITIADSDGWAWLRFDDDGITVRNPFRTYRVGWDEVCCFTDGQAPLRGHHWWALRIVLRDGRGITAIGTSGRGGTARPGTLAAIRQAASRHEIPAVFTGKRVGHEQLRRRPSSPIRRTARPARSTIIATTRHQGCPQPVSRLRLRTRRQGRRCG